MLQGETISTGAPNPCPECNLLMNFKVCVSNGGYYVGTQCKCGPYSRETGYYLTHQEADKALKRLMDGDKEPLRS